jgi:O-6-methylguanine DNA methyltransferase
MILEYGKIRGLPGVVCVLKEDGRVGKVGEAGRASGTGRIVAVLPFLCEKLEAVMPSYAKDHVQKVMGIKLEKIVKTDMNYLAQHLKGEKSIEFSEISQDHFSAFQKAVYKKLLSTRPGTVLTYGQLAQSSGHKNAARAVGTTMRKNPMPILIPCHRVSGAAGKESFSIPCMKKRPDKCSTRGVSKTGNCSERIKSMLRKFEVNG